MSILNISCSEIAIDLHECLLEGHSLDCITQCQDGYSHLIRFGGDSYLLVQ